MPWFPSSPSVSSTDEPTFAPEAAKPTPDPVLTRLVWLAALWLGSRLIAGVIAAPFLGEGAQLDPARLVITQVPFWAATVGGLYWISRREGERFGPFVRWGFKPPDALVGLVAGFGLHWGVNLLYRALDSVGVSGDPSESARKLVESLHQAFPGRPIVFMLGVSQGHSAEHILAELAPAARALVLTRSRHPRALADLDALAGLAAPLLQRAGERAPLAIEPDVAAALGRARALARPGDLVCVTGSLFVVAQAREALGLAEEVD